MEAWGRHYDSLLWIVTTIMATVIGGLLVATAREFDILFAVAGLLISYIAVYLTASFGELRHKVEKYYSKEIGKILKNRKFCQWPAYLLIFIILSILWVELLVKNYPNLTWLRLINSIIVIEWIILRWLEYKESKQVKLKSIINKYRGSLTTLISGSQVPFDNNLHRNLPTEGGVYRILETSSDWKQSIYIGKTGNLQDRIYYNLLMGDSGAHTLKRKLISGTRLLSEETVKQYLKDECQIQYLIISDERERSLFEHFAISILKPRYND